MGISGAFCSRVREQIKRARLFPVVLVIGSFCLSFQVVSFSFAADPVAASIWFLDHNALKRVDAQTNAVAQSLNLTAEPQAITVDPRDGAVWVLLHKQLVKFDAAGKVLRDIDLKKVAAWKSDARYLAINPYDGSVWLADQSTVLHLDSDGVKIAQNSLLEPVRALAVDIDESLWALTKKSLVRLNPQANIQQQVDIRAFLHAPRYLSVDGLSSTLWVASRKKLVRFNLNQLSAAPAVVALPTGTNNPSLSDTSDDADNDPAEESSSDAPRRILLLANHPTFGTLWVAVKDALLFFDRNGNYIKTLDLSGYALGKTRALVYEPTGPGLWIAGKRFLLRFTGNGEFVTLIPADKQIDAMGAGSFRLLPSISILAPENGLVTNNARPQFRVGVGASCSGIPCSLGNIYLQSLVLDATINGQSIGSLFQLSGEEMQYWPAARLPEGLNLFSVTAKDLFGHVSEQTTSRFTIDTVAPRFLVVAPANGSSFTTETITISGQVDDAGASVLLLDPIGKAISMGGATFSFSVTLKSGVNNFVLVARDPVGNEAAINLTLTYQTSDIVVTEPVPGSTVNTDSLLLCGTFQGPPNTGITVNGIVALVSGNKFCVNDLALAPGTNTLTIVMTFPDGRTATKTITVTSTGSALFRVSASPQSGIAPSKTSFVVSKNGTAVVSRIVADFNGDGAPDLSTPDPNAVLEYTYTTAGVYRPRFTITGSDGSTTTVENIVAVKTLAEIDAMLRGIYTGMLGQLRAGNIDGAINAVSGGVREKYKKVFTTLQSNLASVVDRLGTIHSGAIGEQMAEYVVVRTEGGTSKAFLLYIIRSEDGVWRIDGM